MHTAPAVSRPARLLTGTVAAAAAALLAPAFASEALAKPVKLEPVPMVTIQTEVDLSDEGDEANIGGTIFMKTDPDPTGTGVIRSFVRLQSPGNETTEAGHNTDDRPLQNDENNSAQFTRSLLIDDLAVFEVDGTDYYKLLLDLNEPNGRGQALISLDEFELYQAATPTLNGYDATTKFGSDATLVYDLDATTDQYLKLNDTSSGSGTGDLFALVPTSFFGGAGDYLYLYSSFGAEFAAGGGFEEWAAITDDKPGTAIPLPPAAWSGIATMALLFGGAGVRRIRASRGQA